MRGHALEGSPHYFRICLRRDLGFPLESQGHDCLQELAMQIDDFADHIPRHDDDIMLVVKAYLASNRPHQVIALCPASRAARIRRGFAQPDGVTERRGICDKMRRNVMGKSRSLQSQGFITAAAGEYLRAWVSGQQLKYTRPDTYRFLSHTWTRDDRRHPQPPPLVDEHALRGVVVEVRENVEVQDDDRDLGGGAEDCEVEEDVGADM